MKKLFFLSLLFCTNVSLLHFFAYYSIDLFLYQIYTIPSWVMKLNFTTVMLPDIGLENMILWGAALVLVVYSLFFRRFWALVSMVLVLLWTLAYAFLSSFVPEPVLVWALGYLLIMGTIYFLNRRSRRQKRWLESMKADLKSKKWHQIKEEYMALQISETHQKISQDLRLLEAKPSYKKIKILRQQLNEVLNYPEKVFEKRVDGLLNQRSLTAHRYYENFYESHQQFIRHKIQTERAYFKNKKESDMSYQDKIRLEAILNYLSHDLVNIYHQYHVIKSALDKADKNDIPKELIQAFHDAQCVESIDRLMAIYQQIQDYSTKPKKV